MLAGRASVFTCGGGSRSGGGGGVEGAGVSLDRHSRGAAHMGGGGGVGWGLGDAEQPQHDAAW